MKKGIVICLILILIVVAAIIVSNNKKEVSHVNNTNNDYLYDIAIDYLKEEYTEEDEYKDKEDFQVFFDYEGFGITEDENIKYAYMWIVEESYYVEDNEVKSGSGSSMAYKIKFVDDVVVNFEIPKDGSEYDESIREMFPEEIANKVLEFNLDDEELKSIVDEHYSYLNEKDEENDNGV